MGVSSHRPVQLPNHSIREDSSLKDQTMNFVLAVVQHHLMQVVWRCWLADLKSSAIRETGGPKCHRRQEAIIDRENLVANSLVVHGESGREERQVVPEQMKARSDTACDNRVDDAAYLCRLPSEFFSDLTKAMLE
jgi:hypothetical protein